MKRSKVENRRFELLSDLELPKVLGGAVIRGCTFFACDFGATATTPAKRRKVKNVEVINCKTTNSTGIGSAIIEDVDIENLETSGPLFAWGAVYKHVRFRGRCGSFVLSSLPPNAHTQRTEAAFKRANAAFYRGVDWALDISEAEFRDIDIRGVPADLIRRDPETQVVVRRANVERLQAKWRSLDLAGTPWAAMLDNVLAWGLEDTVFVAPKRQKHFRRWLAGLKLLRRTKVAELD